MVSELWYVRIVRYDELPGDESIESIFDVYKRNGNIHREKTGGVYGQR